MTSWEEYTGKFPGLKVPKVGASVLMMIYKTVLYERRRRTIAAREADPDSFVDPHSKWLSFDEEKQIEEYEGADKKAKPKPTYTAEVSEQEEYKGEDGKNKKRVVRGKKTMVTKNKVKWYTAMADFRSTLSFIVQRIVKEMYDFYVHGGHKFPEEQNILSEFATFASQPLEPGQFNIAPFILACTDRIDVTKRVSAIYGRFDTLLLEKLSDIFKGKDDSIPSRQLNKLCDRIVNFLKLIAVQIANLLWYEKKLHADSSLILMAIRSLEIAVGNEITLDEMFFKVLAEWNAEMGRILESQKEERKQKAEANKAAKANTPALDSNGTPTSTGESIADALDDVGEVEWEEDAPIEDDA